MAHSGASCFRSRSQFYVLIGFGLLIAVLGLFGAAQSRTRTGSIGDAVVAIVLGLACMAVAVRAAVLAGDEGITIRNPLGRTRHIPWAAISDFKIGRYMLLDAVCVVELCDGSTVHAWAIQIPRASRNPARSREARMIEELNGLVASRGRPWA